MTIQATRDQDAAEKVSQEPFGSLRAPWGVLMDVLATVAPAVSTPGRRHPAPETRCVRLSVRDGHALVEAFDYEVGVRVTLPGDAEGEGLIHVDHAEMGKVLKALAKGLKKAAAVRMPVEIRWQEHTVTVCANGYEMPLLTPCPMSQGLSMPEVDAVTHLLPREPFLAQASRVATVADRGDTLPMLTCLRMVLDGAGVSLTATDRYRLATVSVASPGTMEGEIEGAAPAPVVVRLLKVLPGEVVGLGIAEAPGARWLVLDCDNVHAVVRLMDGEYPKVSSILFSPEKAAGSVTIEAATLLTAVETSQALIDAIGCKSVPTVLRVEGQHVTVAPQLDVDRPSVTAPVLGAEVEGSLEGMRIAVNGRFAADMLKNHPGTRVRIYVQDPNRPLLTVDPDADDTFKHMLMTVRIVPRD